MKNSDLAQMSLLTALALIFGYIESLFPIPVPIPGIKLGFSNIVILFALNRLDSVKAFTVMLLKVFISSLLFGGMSALFYSLAGGLFAFFAMLAAQRSGFGVIGESAAGGVFHNIGQLTAAAIMLGSSAPIAYLPILLPAGAVIGIITGSVCKAVMKKI